MASRTLMTRCVTQLQHNRFVARTIFTNGSKNAEATPPVPILLKLDEDRVIKRPRQIPVSTIEDISAVSGVPPEHIKDRTVRIYQPAKNAMQSGTNNIGFWQIDFDNRERWENPLIGWSSTGDPMSNLKVDFASVDEAIQHCKKMKWKYFIQKPNADEPKPRSYGANFAWNKRTRVSTK